MILIDTSVWISILREKSGAGAERLRQWLGDREPVLTRFNQLELLRGCRDEEEWKLLAGYLENQVYLEAGTDTWTAAASIYFELRRRGQTVRSPIDCCIARIALEHGVLLLHRDLDFSAIAAIRPLTHLFWQAGSD